jgi:hypothetical protein
MAHMSKTHLSKRLGKRELKNMQEHFCNYKWLCFFFLSQNQNKIKIISQASANSVTLTFIRIQITKLVEDTNNPGLA